MKSNTLLGLLTCLLAASALVAEDRIRWAPDFRTACELAAEQRRLVLMHFYNDNCPPCLRLEQNVFSQDTVSDAIAQNYIPVKVHAGQNPQLASRYQIQRWPTDVIVTSSGLEIHRTISPQSPTEYIALANRIAEQAGISSGRQWQSPLNKPQPPQPQTSGAAPVIQPAAPTPPPEVARSGPAPSATGENRSPAVQSPAPTAPPVAQNPPEPPLRSRFVAPQVAATSSISPAPIENAWMAAAPVVSPPAPPVNSPPPAAPVTSAPPESPVVANQPAAAPPPAAPLPQSPAFAQQSLPPVAPAPPVVPMLEANLVPASQAPPIALEGHCPVTLLEKTNWEKGDPRFGAIHQNSTYLFVSLEERQRFLADPERFLLPPLAMDGYCPVTLRDNMKWQKGDKQFFAVHRGRTYYLATAADRAKFLAAADAFAPVLSGCDVVRFAQKKELVDGKRAYGLMTPDKQIYLFADKQTLEQFEKSSGAYATLARQAMLRSESGAIYR